VLRDLARRVRTSKHLTGSQKRYWLAVLPHLHVGDRERLDGILRGDPAAMAATAAALDAIDEAGEDSADSATQPPASFDAR